MARPIPLTANPSDPQSPAGAIPVSLFGVEGGGGGGGVRQATTTIQVAPEVASRVDVEIQMDAVRIGDIVFASVQLSMEEGDYRDEALFRVGEGFTPADSTPSLMGEASHSGGISAATFVATPDGVGTLVSTDSESQEELYLQAFWITDDPFPEV